MASEFKPATKGQRFVGKTYGKRRHGMGRPGAGPAIDRRPRHPGLREPVFDGPREAALRRRS